MSKKIAGDFLTGLQISTFNSTKWLKSWIIVNRLYTFQVQSEELNMSKKFNC